jgi:hypothetical protein
MAAWGVLVYGIAVVVLRRQAGPSDTELQTLLAIRQAIAARLAGLQRAPRAVRSELSRSIAGALLLLDEEIIPSFRQLVERQRELSQHLASYERGALPSPDSASLARLHAIDARQRSAVERCIREAANAEARLTELLQERDETTLINSVQVWAQDLTTIHDALAEGLRGGREGQALAAVSAPPDGAPPRAPMPGTDGRDSPDLAVGSGEPFSRLVEAALRQLNKPATLAKCDLIARLPYTLASTRAQWSDVRLAEPTSLE